MNNYLSDRRKVLKAFSRGCFFLFLIPIFVLILSICKGANWKVLIPGVPVYLTLSGGAVYQLVKELRILKQQKCKADLTKFERRGLEDAGPGGDPG
jgi:hypothetical protein